MYPSGCEECGTSIGMRVGAWALQALVRDKWAPRPVQGDPSATDHNLHVHVAGPMVSRSYAHDRRQETTCTF